MMVKALDCKKIYSFTASLVFHVIIFLLLSRLFFVHTKISSKLIQVNLIELPQKKKVAQALPPPPIPKINVQREINRLNRIKPMVAPKPKVVKPVLNAPPIQPSISQTEKLIKHIESSTTVYKPVAVRIPKFTQNTKTAKTGVPSSKVSRKVGPVNPDILSQYEAIVREKIKRHKIYPVEAIEEGIEGRVFVAFTLNKYGRLKQIKIVKSSGYVLLDRAAVYSIKRSSPFPPFPKGLNESLITLKLWVKFRLE